MGIRKIVKKQVKKIAKRESARLRMGAPIIDLFVPGLGTVSRQLADQYDRLGAMDKKKFHRVKGKAAKERFLKSIK